MAELFDPKNTKKEKKEIKLLVRPKKKRNVANKNDHLPSSDTIMQLDDDD